MPRRQGTERPRDTAAAVRDAAACFERGAFFEAHEHLEEAWRAAGTDREAWKGACQLAVALTHLQRDNPRGGARVLRRAVGNLARAVASGAPPGGGAREAGLDVETLARLASRLLLDLAAGRVDLAGGLVLPRLR